MEAKERTAEARGERACSEESESYGKMTKLKTNVNAYDTAGGFLGTKARRASCERMEVGGVLPTPGTASEMLELRGQTASRTGSAEELLRVSKSVGTGAAAASPKVLRVSQASVPRQGLWTRRLHSISVEVQGDGVRLAATRRDVHLPERGRTGNSSRASPLRLAPAEQSL